MSDSSHINLKGGQIRFLDMGDSATAILLGGRIDNIDSWQRVLGSNEIPNPHIEMLVKDYMYNTQMKILKGTWGNDSLFKIQLIDHTQYGYSPAIDNIKFTIVPEPVTLALLAVGGMMIRRRM